MDGMTCRWWVGGGSVVGRGGGIEEGGGICEQYTI